MEVNEIKEEKITEEQLEALYIYLSFAFDTMEKDEQLFWVELMKQLDKEFTEEKNLQKNGSKKSNVLSFGRLF